MSGIQHHIWSGILKTLSKICLTLCDCDIGSIKVSSVQVNRFSAIPKLNPQEVQFAERLIHLFPMTIKPG